MQSFRAYLRYLWCDDWCQAAQFPPLLQHILSVLVTYPHAQFHLYPHKNCLEGAIRLYLLKYMAGLHGISMAKAECILHSDKKAGARFAARFFACMLQWFKAQWYMAF